MVVRRALLAFLLVVLAASAPADLDDVNKQRGKKGIWGLATAGAWDS
jgi:hypothetical protein